MLSSNKYLRQPLYRLFNRPIAPLYICRTHLRHNPSRSLWNLFSRKPPAAAKPKAKTAATKPAYGEHLLFYYTGRRAVYLGTLKLYTVLLFGYCTLMVAPSIGLDTAYGILAPVAAVLGGLIPFAFVQYLSPPYVTHAYIQLPSFARYSKDHLFRFLKNLTRDENVQLATIRWLGRPKIVKMTLGELQPTRRRMGCVNIQWMSSHGKQELFYMDTRGSPAKTPEPRVFQEVMRAIQRHAKGSATP